jgi:hypothetical protein
MTSNPGASRRAFVPAAALAVALLYAPPQAHAGETVYRVVGPDGEVSYTDTPPGQGEFEALELEPVNTQPALEPGFGVGALEESQTAPYERVAIVAPENDTTIPPGQLNVVVQLELEPPLRAGHLVQFFLDGTPQGEPAATTSVTLSDLYRGSRTIQARVIDNDSGAVIAQSNGVVIHVKRHSVKHKSLTPKTNAP